MIQRGKKSTASLSVVTPIPGQRPEPPRSLSNAEACVWRQTVATKPADWFQADSWPMLTLYCRAVVAGDMLSQRIADAIAAAEAGVESVTIEIIDKLLAMRDREGKAVNTYARAMRLTHQSRLKAETAATAHNRANGGGGAGLKPWQTA